VICLLQSTVSAFFSHCGTGVPPVRNTLIARHRRDACATHSRIQSALSFLAILTLLTFATGCVSTDPSRPYSPSVETDRDPAASQRLTQEAVPLMKTKPARAEALLRDALNADLYNGPAHNNLGAIYLSQGKLYEAAGEFEWARKLMPGHPDPRLNLALTLEKAGRTDDALTTYATALEVYPEHIPTMQALSRLQVRSGRTDDRTAAMLNEIALRGESPTWRDWARLQLTLLPSK
jgi:Tfp pilus assembly protein PilF